MSLVRIGAAEEHGANGRQVESFSGGDVMRADVERGEDDERRHARPGPRRVRGGLRTQNAQSSLRERTPRSSDR